MERQEVIEKLTGFLRKALAKKDIEIQPDKPFSDLGLNSSGRLEFFTMIEDAFDLMLDEDEQDAIKCLNDAVELVLSKVS
ncbi:MAG: acyl carrier protein [Desulfobacterota bacterium]|nr:acyl carrier protein [Thermodesulfobacteriota bacterium]